MLLDFGSDRKGHLNKSFARHPFKCAGRRSLPIRPACQKIPSSTHKLVTESEKVCMSEQDNEAPGAIFPTLTVPSPLPPHFRHRDS